MRNNETGEFELVVGNRQLLSGFFIVVLLFAVAFAMGYVVGQNSPRSVRMASAEAPPASVTAPNASDRPQPLSPATPATTPTAEPTGAQPAAGAASQPTTQPAQGSQPAAETPPAAASAAPGAELPAGSYWQVMAVGRATAEAMQQTLKDKGFPVVLAAAPNDLTRVLVGPFPDAAALGRAKSELENAGMRPIRFKRD